MWTGPGPCSGGGSGRGRDPIDEATGTDCAGSSITTATTAWPPGPLPLGCLNRIRRRDLKRPGLTDLELFSVGPFQRWIGQALAAYQGQPKPSAVAFESTGDHSGSLAIQRELRGGRQRTGAAPTTQLLLHSCLADEFGHGLLTQVAAFFRADLSDETQFQGIGLSIELTGSRGESALEPPMLKSRRGGRFS